MPAPGRFFTCTLTRGGTVTDTVWIKLDDIGICAAAGSTAVTASINARTRR
jgi:hypothetical protein